MTYPLVTLSLYFLHLTCCVAILIRLSVFHWRSPGLCWIFSIKASSCCNYLTICSFGSLNLWTCTKNSDSWAVFNVNSGQSKRCLKRRTKVLTLFFCDQVTLYVLSARTALYEIPQDFHIYFQLQYFIFWWALPDK